MQKEHKYTLTLDWTGNKGTGTSHYKEYGRSHTVNIKGKAELECSADPSFRGDNTKHNPEELFLASISGCHMLWYLHLCAVNGVTVTAYTDNPEGIMETEADGNGRFTLVTLHPDVTVTEESMMKKANELHEKANKMCFIANSCNFPIRHEPVCNAGQE